MSGASKGRAVAAVLLTLLKIVWVSAMIVTPLLGMWLSSSLAAYRNSSLLVSVLVGLLLFPIIPLAWEAVSSWRRSRKESPRAAILTRLDRLVLRTVCLNLLFIVVTVWSAPATSFRALATRGDWMLEGRTGGVSDSIRGHLFTVADILEGLYGRAETNHYGVTDTTPPDEPPAPTDLKTKTPIPSDRPDATPTIAVGATTYPANAKLHPIIASIPESSLSSHEAVARYIDSNVSDPFDKVKALHDFVTQRLTYDQATFEAYEAGLDVYPSQEAADVFVARTAVCAGYSKLLAAMAAEVGIEIAYVVGRGGRDGWEVDGVAHAWNAAKIDGAWYLIDATWNDGQDDYSTDYLFTPPELFRLDHLPEDDRWQLHPKAISVSEFMRQPMISAGFILLGLEMREPDRAQVTVGKNVLIELGNPRRVHILAKVQQKGAPGRDCAIKADDGRSIIDCAFPKSGRYTVDVYGKSGSRSGSYPHIAKLFVNSK